MNYYRRDCCQLVGWFETKSSISHSSLVWKLQPQHSVSRPRGKTKKGRKKKIIPQIVKVEHDGIPFPVSFKYKSLSSHVIITKWRRGKTGIRQTTPTRYFRRNWKWATARQSNQLVYTYTKAFTRITLERCAHTTSGVAAYYTPWPEM